MNPVPVQEGRHEVQPADDFSFRIFVQTVRDYALFMLDTQGYVTTWNTGAQAINGYLADEIIGRHFSVFYPPELLEREQPRRDLESAARDGHSEEEGWRVRKDGTHFWASVVLTPLARRMATDLARSFVPREAKSSSTERSSVRGRKPRTG